MHEKGNLACETAMVTLCKKMAQLCRIIGAYKLNISQIDFQKQFLQSQIDNATNQLSVKYENDFDKLNNNVPTSSHESCQKHGSVYNELFKDLMSRYDYFLKSTSLFIKTKSDTIERELVQMNEELKTLTNLFEKQIEVFQDNLLNDMKSKVKNMEQKLKSDKNDAEKNIMERIFSSCAEEGLSLMRLRETYEKSVLDLRSKFFRSAETERKYEELCVMLSDNLNKIKVEMFKLESKVRVFMIINENVTGCFRERLKRLILGFDKEYLKKELYYVKKELVDEDENYKAQTQRARHEQEKLRFTHEEENNIYKSQLNSLILSNEEHIKQLESYVKVNMRSEGHLPNGEAVFNTKERELEEKNRLLCDDITSSIRRLESSFKESESNKNLEIATLRESLRRLKDHNREKENKVICDLSNTVANALEVHKSCVQNRKISQINLCTKESENLKDKISEMKVELESIKKGKALHLNTVAETEREEIEKYQTSSKLNELITKNENMYKQGKQNKTNEINIHRERFDALLRFKKEELSVTNECNKPDVDELLLEDNSLERMICDYEEEFMELMRQYESITIPSVVSGHLSHMRSYEGLINERERAFTTTFLERQNLITNFKLMMKGAEEEHRKKLSSVVNSNNNIDDREEITRRFSEVFACLDKEIERLSSELDHLVGEEIKDVDIHQSEDSYKITKLRNKLDKLKKEHKRKVEVMEREANELKRRIQDEIINQEKINLEKLLREEDQLVHDKSLNEGKIMEKRCELHSFPGALEKNFDTTLSSVKSRIEEAKALHRKNVEKLFEEIAKTKKENEVCRASIEPMLEANLEPLKAKMKSMEKKLTKDLELMRNNKLNNAKVLDNEIKKAHKRISDLKEMYYSRPFRKDGAELLQSLSDKSDKLEKLQSDLVALMTKVRGASDDGENNASDIFGHQPAISNSAQAPIVEKKGATGFEKLKRLPPIH